MSILLNASAVPAVQVASGWLSPAAAYALSTTAPQARSLPNTGVSVGLLAGFDENAMRTDLALRHPGGPVRCVVGGLTLSASGLTATVATGQAILDGLLEISAAITGVALTPSTTNFLWLRANKSVTIQATNATPSGVSANPAVYLGCLTTDGAGVTATDTAGVVYAGGGGIRYRQTADSAKPTDTPPSSADILTVTASGGTWLWQGASGKYFRLVTDQPVVGETPTGTVDGANVTFTLAHAPVTGTLQLYQGASSGGSVSRLLASAYSLSGSTVTMTTAPASGQALLADYRF